MSKTALLVSVLLVAGLFSAPAYGEHKDGAYYWNAATGGYETVANWTTGALNTTGPAYGSVAYIENGGVSTAAVYYSDLGDPIGAYKLYIGRASGSGTLNIQLPTDPDPQTDDDSFCVKRTWLGDTNPGTINHTSGTFFAKRAVFLGSANGGVGTYNLSGTGLLEQSTYWNHTGDRPTLNIGYAAGATGTLTQSGASTINAFRDAELHGIAAPDANLYIGRSGTGTYNLNGGTLIADAITVDSDGTTNSGTWNINDAGASIEVRVGLAFGGLANLADNTVKLTAVAGTQIHMVGAREDVGGGVYALNNAADFENRSLDASAATGLGGLNNVTLIFEGGYSPTSLNAFAGMEVAGEDVGPSTAGLNENFALEGLTLGGADVGYVQLADSNDNQANGVADALYVQNLIIGAGSMLDLSGLNLYYYNGEINGTVLAGGGALIQIDLIKGDADKNVIVDGSDLNLLLTGWGTGTTWQEGDFDGDGDVDGSDLNWLLTNWTYPPPAAASVPEPATLGLLAFGAVALVRRRRRA